MIRPAPVSQDLVRRFTRGTEDPRGVVWFGAVSFWGHLRHLASAAVAADNIDSRDWMTPDDPQALTDRIVQMLGGRPGAATVTDGIGRDLFIDFVADTGDDVSVSRAVARLVFAAYELPDPDRPGEVLAGPRGDVLFFGGDTAYPVATAKEIQNRVIVPWNQVLQELPDDGRPRVLLGIPGNHDWYDGLDGFCRMFRRRPPADADAPPNLVEMSQSMIKQYAEWARQFLRGDAIDKPSLLVLDGYTPIQNASHFALRLAPKIDLLAADRQLTTVDWRQQQLLRGEYQSRPDTATLLLLPDPVVYFGGVSKTGTEMIERLQIDLAERETFVLSGDLHHYERFEHDKVLHVIAGGGGAFLHPTRVAPDGVPPTVAWPSPAQSHLLLREVPWKLALGRSGMLPHVALLALYAPVELLGGRLAGRAGLSVALFAALFALIGLAFALIGGGIRRKRVLLAAVLPAAIAAAIPFGASSLVQLALQRLQPTAPAVAVMLGAALVAAIAGTFVFGAFLVLLTLRGYEHMQALTALDHPGFKHFVRLRVRADGRGIDGWCIGIVDPLGPGQQPVLVDQFTWRPFR